MHTSVTFFPHPGALKPPSSLAISHRISLNIVVALQVKMRVMQNVLPTVCVAAMAAVASAQTGAQSSLMPALFDHYDAPQMLQQHHGAASQHARSCGINRPRPPVACWDPVCRRTVQRNQRNRRSPDRTGGSKRSSYQSSTWGLANSHERSSTSTCCAYIAHSTGFIWLSIHMQAQV